MKITYKIKGNMIGSNIIKENANKIKIENGWIHIEKGEETVSTKMEFIYDIEITK